MARKKISVETKFQAVMSLLRQEEPASKIARRYEVSPMSLNTWKEQFLERGKQGLRDGKEDGEIKQLKKEISHQKQLIADLSVANLILKKNLGE